MNKTVTFLLLFTLSACNGFGPNKVKNVVELSHRISTQSTDSIALRLASDERSALHFDTHILQNKWHGISNHKIICEPVFASNMFYILDNKGNVSAFERGTNRLLWSHNVSNDRRDVYVGGGILYHDNKLYVTYGSRLLAVLDAESGHEQIRKELPDLIKVPPVIRNNIVIIQTIGNQTFALDTTSLNPIWQHEGLAETLSSSYHVTPIVYGNSIVTSYSSGQILALNIQNGEVLWATDLSNTTMKIGLPNFEDLNLICAPVVYGSHIYVASGSGKLIKLDLATGKIAWQVNAGDVQSMSLIASHLFVTNNARQVAAIDITSGRVQFLADLDNNPQPNKSKATVFLSPFISIANNQRHLNVIAINGSLYSFAFDANGYISQTPVMTKIAQNIQHCGKSWGEEVFCMTDKVMMFSAR